MDVQHMSHASGCRRLGTARVRCTVTGLPPPERAGVTSGARPKMEERCSLQLCAL